MDIRLLTTPQDLSTCDAWVRAHPQGTLWQSLAWKRYQEALGRETRIYAAVDGEIRASALVVIDRTVCGLSTWDLVRGPLGEVGYGGKEHESTGEVNTRVRGQRPEKEIIGKLLTHIIEEARADRAMTLYVSPLIPHVSFPTHARASMRAQMPEATRIIDLTLSEAEILAQMRSKGRYNIGLSLRHGVRVKHSRDIDAWYSLVRETAARDGFTPLPRAHYRAFLEHLSGSFLLLAHCDGTHHASSSSGSPESSISSPIAGLLGVVWGETGIYYYGASSSALRSLMAPSLLQWEAMQYCKAQGCGRYDLFGIAPVDASATHPWHGISAFKEKFGGSVTSYPPEQEIVLRQITKTLLQWKRRVWG